MPYEKTIINYLRLDKCKKKHLTKFVATFL